MEMILSIDKVRTLVKRLNVLLPTEGRTAFTSNNVRTLTPARLTIIQRIRDELVTAVNYHAYVSSVKLSTDEFIILTDVIDVDIKKI
jgi:hypothetical protein